MAASFPTSLKTFATLADDVDKVLAAHQNDANDEITAIEAYLFDSSVGIIPGGRLSLSTDPAPTTDITGASVVYYEPYLHDQIGLYLSSSDFAPRTFGELSLSLAGYSASDNVDIFIYDDSGTPAITGVLWTDNTTRAAAISRLQGVLVASTDYAKRYVGSVRISSSTDCEDSETRRLVFNAYNQLPYSVSNTVCAVDHTFATTDWREVNGSTDVTRGEIFLGLPQVIMLSGEASVYSASGTSYGQIGIAVDTTTSYNALLTLESSQATLPIQSSAFLPHSLAAGYHYLTFTEINGSANMKFYSAKLRTKLLR